MRRTKREEITSGFGRGISGYSHPLRCPSEIRRSCMRVRLRLLGFVVCLMAFLPALAQAAVPTGGTVSPLSKTASWTGGPFVVSNPAGVCLGIEPSCDTYSLTIVPPSTGNYTVEIAITPSAEGDDYDLYVDGPAGHTRRQLDLGRQATRRSCSRTRPPGRTASARWPGSSPPAAPTAARRRWRRHRAAAHRRRAACSIRTTRPPRRRPSRCRSASSPSASRRASSTRRRCSARSRTSSARAC